MAELRDDAPLVIEVTGGADHPVIGLIGELDISNVDILAARIEPLLARAPAALDFDLGRLTFLDSSGIAVLLRTAGNVKALTLLNPSSSVRRIIVATGLTEVLRMTP